MTAPERAFFEPGFAENFAQVRLHFGSQANEAAESLGARAFTAGHDIVFAQGQYAPGSAGGTTLLAHELMHVVQQRSAGIGRAKAQCWPAPPEEAAQPEVAFSDAERAQVEEWIRAWRVNHGLGFEPLGGERAANQLSLAEGIVSQRLRARGDPGLVFEPETDPEVRALAEGPVARLYEQAVPAAFDTLSAREEAQLRSWMTSGRIGLAETLTGEREQELDALARAIFCNRAALPPRETEDPLLCIEDRVTRADPRFRALLAGPVTRTYDAWDSVLQSAVRRPWVRGNPREQRVVAVRRISRLYARYCIPDWAAWYSANIDTSASFLGARVIGGLHRRAAAALAAAEARLRASSGGATRLRGRLGPHKPGLGGYNARGWGDTLGAHDFGMAFDLDPSYNIEVRGPRTVAWAGTPAGDDRIAAVKLFTGFDLLAFTAASDWDRNTEAAADASDEIVRRVSREITRTAGENEAAWALHRDELLRGARDNNAYPSLLRAAVSDPRRLTREGWLRFLRGLEGRGTGVGSIGFFNIPVDVVSALTDPLRRGPLRFHWAPFHHFELVDWRAVVTAEGACFPVTAARAPRTSAASAPRPRRRQAPSAR